MKPVLFPVLAAATLALAACAATPGPGPRPGPAVALPGGEWNVERIEETPLAPRSFIAMTFGTDGRVLGRAACNGWSAGYRVEGRAISFTQGAATLKACLPPLGDQEGRFHRVLSEVRRYEILPDGTLLLLTADGRAIRARRG
jgi:heat shock protein HslJ